MIALLPFLAMVPTVLVLAAVAALLSRWLHEGRPANPTSLRFFVGADVRPEPLEQILFFLLLSAPVVLLGTSGLLARFGRNLARRRNATHAALTVQAALGIFIAYCWWRQDRYYQYFSPLMVAVAVVGGAAVSRTLRPGFRGVRKWPALNSRRTRQVIPILLAVAITTVGLLPSLFHEGNVAASHGGVHGHLSYTMDEFFAVANGRTTLVDFVPQYSNVLPYVIAPVLAATKFSVGTFTAAMFLLSGMALLSVYYVLSRVTGSTGTALVLYVPFIGLSLYRALSAGDQHFYIANYYAMLPLRYFGPFVIAALLMWHLAGRSSVRLHVLFLVAALVAVNNPDFGIPALLAAVSASWIAHRESPASLRALPSVVVPAIAGALGAVLLFTVLGFARGGSLPDFGMAFYYSRQFAMAGFFMLPMPVFGLHLVIAVTLVGAVVRSVVRARSDSYRFHEARLLTGAMAFAAVFGLGSSAYYVGRSHPAVLVALFSTWAFVLVLLAWDAWTSARAAEEVPAVIRRLWAIPSFLVAAHLLLAASPLLAMRDFPAQLQRIVATGHATIMMDDEMVSFVRRHTNSGEDVLILAPLSHRIALAARVNDVFPYNNVTSIVTHNQLEMVREQLVSNGVTKVFSGADLASEISSFLTEEGYRSQPADTDGALTLWRRTAVLSR